MWERVRMKSSVLSSCLLTGCKTVESVDQKSSYPYKCLQNVVLTNGFVNILEIGLYYYPSSIWSQFHFRFEQMICHLFLLFVFFLIELKFWTVTFLKAAESKLEVDGGRHEALPLNFMK